jgi:perosamine synthetase
MNEAAKPLTWWEPAFGEEEQQAVARVVERGYVNEGPVTEEFSEQVARLLGVKHVVAACNGTAALFLALRACGVGPGDEVVVPDLTFVASASSVVLCGARPVLVDIRDRDLNLDPERVADALTPRTRAILAVSINGRAADFAALRELAGPREIAVLEDAAQGIGSRWDGRAVGSFGDAACISLAPTKMITSGQGGLVATDRDEIRERVVRLKDHGRLERSWNHHPEVGFNFKFSDLHAALGLAQLRRLPERLERARAQYRRYAEGLGDAPGLAFVPTAMERGSVPLWVDVLADDAEALIAFLGAQQIEGRRIWPALHTQWPYRTAGEFPHASTAAEHGLWLPSGPGKSEADIERVVGAVLAFAETRPSHGAAGGR